MMKLTETGKILGAQVLGLDLSRPLDAKQVNQIIWALGQHGVLEFPEQQLTTEQLKVFSANFGQLYVSPGGRAQAPGHPEVMILSNIVQHGQALGLKDAGQSWHTDMSYSDMIAFANVLYGLEIPHRNGLPLGDTQFVNTRAVYRALPADVTRTLEGRTITHDFNKFWEMMRAKPGSTRPPLSEAEKKLRQPAVHPALLTHPITHEKVLYANPGYAISISDMPEHDSEQLLKYLFDFQMEEKFHYSYQWKQNSLLIWDNMGTMHNAVADYGPDEPRYIKRCQVMATKFFGDDGTSHPYLFNKALVGL
jgi:taurine dioxygenase